MASASDPALASAFAAAAAHTNVNQMDALAAPAQTGCGPESAEGGSVNATTTGADLAAAFTSFLANQAETFEPSNLSQAVLSNLQLVGILGLLPQQPGPGSDLQQQNDTAKGQDAIPPQNMLSKEENVSEGRATAVGPPVSTTSQVGSPQPPSAAHQHLHHPHPPHQQPMTHMSGMPPQPARLAAPQPPGRWQAPAMSSPHHWDFPAAACGLPSQQQQHHHHQQQHASAGPPGPMGSAHPGQQPPASYANLHQTAPAQGSPPQLQPSAPGSAPPPQPQPTGPVPTTAVTGPHPPPPPLRGYPYGPYGEPTPYPPHLRPPPGPYHHPAIAAPHGHMVPFHPAYPPMHHLPPRAAYYTHDGRFPPPMGPCHPGYPPPPGYFRGHPGLPPPHPHPAYHYMPPPPPYGGHHPSMHPGMYHTAQGVGHGQQGGQHPHEGHPRDSAHTASAASAGTAVCGGIGSDGGTDPVSAARQAAAKVNGSSGGSESEEVGLEAVITLRPGTQDHENASGDRVAAGPNGAEDTLEAGGPNSGGELLADGGATVMHMHKVPPPWSHAVAPLPPHAVSGPMPSVSGYEWPHSVPPPPPMMPGYPPLPPPQGWHYPYDPMAAAMHHHQHQHMMMSSGDMPEDEDEDPALVMHPVQRSRRPSQSSFGGQLAGGVPPQASHQAQLYTGMRRPPYPHPPHPGYAMPVGAGKGPFGVDPAMLQRPPSSEGLGQGSVQLQRSGSLGQLFAAAGDGQANVSRRTQRLKKRRSADSGQQQQQQPGVAPDPFIAAMAAAERAAMGRDSSTGSGAQIAIPPMFVGSGGTRRSSNGSDRTALQCRALVPTNNRQRSDPGYLIENGDQGVGWGLGVGAMAGPMAGLGQLVHYPQPQQAPTAPYQPQQARRPSENGLGGGGRVINLPKRFEDAIMTLEYPRGPHPSYMQYDAYDNAAPQLEEPIYEEEEDDGQDVDLGDVADDSDEDYEAGAAARRVYRGGGRQVGAPALEVVTRKRKAPAMREELPQQEKKRKTRDPATISKVVMNCVTILRMVNHDLVYEKEIRNALGNNPDTSKALRLLMNQGKLVRTGQGGRGNPFCYRCTPLGIDTLQRIEDAAQPDDDPSAGPNQEQRAAAVAVVRPLEEC
ncbi:hypothetical protein VaNZ11_015642 [Volvox africanus]|uniref:HTH three-helical bundle domain-containing protein n=1 Tax=Volvox africanus TaxID=51714 RepID=A0ABQ5SNK7_9CHLO|nr:hypothetical protein VaNZ11_015642 [Volvox africanus]